MRNLFLSLFLISSVVCSAQDTDINNFKPDNQKVKFTETNLPIVFIDTQHQVIERENRITAKMKIIDNGEGQLNHMDTLLYPNQTVDYSGYIDLKYRGNSSFTNSDKNHMPFVHWTNLWKKEVRNKKYPYWEWAKTTIGHCWLLMRTKV